MTTDHEPDAATPIRIPIVEERLRIDKERVETGRVVVISTLATDDSAVRETLASTNVRVERVQIGRFVDDAPTTRTEGDRTIVPVFEEVLVKRIRLIEEIHLITETAHETLEQTVPLRRLTVAVERHDMPDAAAAANNASPDDPDV